MLRGGEVRNGGGGCAYWVCRGMRVCIRYCVGDVQSKIVYGHE